MTSPTRCVAPPPPLLSSLKPFTRAHPRPHPLPQPQVSLDNIEKKWLPEISGFCPDTPFVIVGTKCDYRDGGASKPEWVPLEGPCGSVRAPGAFSCLSTLVCLLPLDAGMNIMMRARAHSLAPPRRALERRPREHDAQVSPIVQRVHATPRFLSQARTAARHTRTGWAARRGWSARPRRSRVT